MENIGDQANPHWVQYTGQTPWPTQLTVGDKFIWCGWLPAVWQDYWPNIAQFIVFTVYVSTGDTIRLAWQGLIGTLFACINLELMTFLYPGGAAGAVCETADCVPQPYNEAIVMADVILVLFLFLFSRADENTIKFGMSWHVFFMMDFMNPTKMLGLLGGAPCAFGFEIPCLGMNKVGVLLEPGRPKESLYSSSPRSF